MSAIPAGDLRGEAKAHQRDKNHNTKWARGAKAAPGKRCDLHLVDLASCAECAARPLARDMNRRAGRHYNNHAHNARQHEKKSTVARKLFRNEVVEATDGPIALVSESSSDEEIFEPQIVPNPEIDVMYSFDARTGPARGNDVLSNAVTQAVKRFENKQTENLVKTEYDLVLDGREDESQTADEDDFEMIDHTHLE